MYWKLNAIIINIRLAAPCSNRQRASYDMGRKQMGTERADMSAKAGV